MSFLSVAGVGKRYGSVVALDGIDLEVAQGSRVAVVGSSGSGKTTLLRLIAGFEIPDAGTISLDGEVFTDGSVTVPTHRRSIGVVMQDGALFPHLSVADNIGFGLDRSATQRDDRIGKLMDTVELEPALRDRRPHELSGGQQQRVALARAIARQPKLMLLDEPFSALDTELRETLRKSVADILRAAGITTMLVTHDQAEALSFADQVAVLRQGRLVQVGTPHALYFSPHDRQTAMFIGDAILLAAAIDDRGAHCEFGCIAVDAGGRHGAAEIMLRPEQIRLTPVASNLAASDPDPSVCYGQVTANGFGGSVCTTTIALLPRGGISGNERTSGAPIDIRGTSMDLLKVGTHVRITIVGKAHIF